MNLNYREYGTGQPLIILHGLFGSSDNWQSLGKRLSPYFHVYLIDQRNHGRSGHSNDHTYELMADDLDEFILEKDLEDIILLGHSMGGKTAMTYVQFDDTRLAKLVIVDIAPKGYPMHHNTILEGLNAIDLEVDKTREACDTRLSEYIPGVVIRQFLLKNLYWKKKNQLEWRFNLHVLKRDMENILAQLPGDLIEKPTLFIRGGLSNYILEADYEVINSQFTFATIRTFKGVGHWVHAEAPDRFYELIKDFIGER
jgi:pimeloyl-ACP methyl ester carboxylesterase